jgi:hypothetical protein
MLQREEQKTAHTQELRNPIFSSCQTFFEIAISNKRGEKGLPATIFGGGEEKELKIFFWQACFPYSSVILSCPI